MTSHNDIIITLLLHRGGGCIYSFAAGSAVHSPSCFCGSK
jgi:hypothetical protein